jgi:hypothetical protein
MAEQLHDLVASDVYWTPGVSRIAFLVFFLIFFVFIVILVSLFLLLIVIIIVIVIVIAIVVRVFEGELDPTQVAEVLSSVCTVSTAYSR